MFPILGMVRHSIASQPPGTPPLYILYAREESLDGTAERLKPVGAFEEEPSTQLITKLVPLEPARYDAGQLGKVAARSMWWGQRGGAGGG